MTFYAQHGYGKADKLNVLAGNGAIAGVILSPADEETDGLRRATGAMARHGVETVLDPQTYVYTIPNAVGRCHENLHLDFGPLSWASLTPAHIQAQVEAVLEANARVGTTGPVIAPAPRQTSLNDLWLPLALQYARTMADRAGGSKVLASVVLEEGGLGDWDAIERWLDVATTLDVLGFYIIIGRRSAYPSAWDRGPLSNLLRLVYRLQVLNEYRVILGYTDFTGVAATAMGASAVASGWNYRQRQFLSERWIPQSGGQAPVPRVTSEALLSPLYAQGEMESAARSALGAQILGDPGLRQRIAFQAASWRNAEAVLQHLEALGGCVREVEAAGDPSTRLDHLVQATAHASRLFDDLRRQGARIEAVHPTAAASLAAAVADARRAEGI